MKKTYAAFALISMVVTAAAAPAVRLRVDGVPGDETPSFICGAIVEVVAENVSGAPIDGVVALKVGRWDGEEALSVPCGDSGEWQVGVERRFVLPTASLNPDGYVLTAVASDGAALSKPLKVGLFAPYSPRGLYGIGNGMVCEWSPGRRFYGVTNAFEARDLRPVAIGGGDAFEAAIARAPQAADCGLDWPAKRGAPDLNVPGGKHIHCHSPAGREELKRRARAFGERAARNPQWAIAKLMNEQFYVNRGDFCPDAWADADFRVWLRRRYGDDLARLNDAWATTLSSWDEVAQPISAIAGAGQEAKTGSEAIDWMAAMGKFTRESQAAIRRNPAQSLDWFRWRAWSVNKIFADYVAEAKRAAPEAKVLYGNNYPWPNFFSHIVWPQWRWQDVIELDLQYVCGFEKTLGTNEEMIDILEAAESVGRGKPIWGREVYYQPRYPGEVAALQNWAMAAHGVDVALVFGWKPYADIRREIFKTGSRSWEKRESPPMWFMIDVDGTRLPGYHAAKRSAAEIAALHKRIDMRKLERISGETALYWATDTSAYVMYETFDRPYNSMVSRARTAITAGLRYRGARVEMFDDKTLGEIEPKRFPVCVVPPSPVVSDAALAKLRAYAEKGGRLVLFTPFNTLDVNLRAKGDAGGATGWKGDVRIVGDYPGRYDAHPHEPEPYARWFDGFVCDAGIPRSAWWENDTPYKTDEEKLAPGEGRPVVEVVVRRHAKTGRRYAFVLNKGGSGEGTLRGPDFDGARLLDALTGEPASASLYLPAFGYRVFEIANRFQKEHP